MRSRHLVPVVVSCLAAATTFAADSDVKEAVHLVVTGGAHAGTYDATGTRGGCSVGLSGPGSWGNQLSSSADKDPSHFNSLQLIVPDGKAAATGAKEFMLTVGFGPLLQRSAEYKIDTRVEAKVRTGSGVVTVKDGGATAKVTFSTKTSDGVQLDGTIYCKTVTRARE
jgi:hypothetical protein